MSWYYWTKTGKHAWSDPDQPLPAGVDLFKTAFLNQFIAAYNERRILFFINDDPFNGDAFYLPGSQGPLYYTGWTPIQAGFDVQAASFYFVDESMPGDPGAFIWGAGSLQGGIQAIVGNKGEGTLTSINFHAFLDASSIPNFDAATPAACEAQWWTVQSFNAAMGFPADANFINFRRKRTQDDDFSYGPHQPRDIIGPWLFEDLRRAFAKLTVCFVGLSDRYAQPLGIGTVSRRIRASPGTYISPPSPPGVLSYEDRRTIEEHDYAPPGGYHASANVNQNTGPYGVAIEDQEQIKLFLLMGTQHPDVAGKTIEFDLYLYAVATAADINFQVPELVDSRLSERLFGGRRTAIIGNTSWISSAWIGSDELLTEASVLSIQSGDGSRKFERNGTMVVRMTNPEYP